jgi:hypothetical protein
MDDFNCNAQASIDLARIYDRAFFEEYGAKNAAYRAACTFIAQELFRRFQPRTVIDWGAGAGLHAAALQASGAKVIAVDGVAVAPDLSAEVPRVVLDLTAPVSREQLPLSYDLSLCIDVLEHIDERHADRVLETITQGAALVILSCAPPGQRGHHHVNEQPRRYWIGRMKSRGWTYDRKATSSLEQHFLAHRAQLPWTWMFHNLCIYRPDAH